MQILAEGIELKATTEPRFEEILTKDALSFVLLIEQEYGTTREQLLESRRSRQEGIENHKERLDFLRDTEGIRKSEWMISPIPADLEDRRVEITGPSGDAKMVINAFNSGAMTYMSDFEDSQSPTWSATMLGQLNLRDAIAGNIHYTSPEGKEYKLNENIATLIVRPRGLHLLDNHVLVGGKPISAAFLDYGLFLFHNAKTLIRKR